MNRKVLIADNIEEQCAAFLTDHGLAVTKKTGLAKGDLSAELALGYDALVVRSATKVRRESIEAANSLAIIGRAGVGVDNIDVEAASERGILVVNSPDGNTLAAAEHAMALMLALSRNLPQGHLGLCKAEWNRKQCMGVELYGKTLGILGLGKIGRQVASRARAFGMEVVAYDPYINDELARKMGVAPVDFDSLLARVDYLSLHLPITDATRKIIDAAALARMKPTARIVNCARGALVDEEALANALNEERIGGAAVDVFSQEPPPESNPLLAAKNIVLTPHLGASTKEAQARVALDVARQIVSYLEEGTILHAVNAVALPGETAAALAPYLDLARRLGAFQAQLVKGQLRSIRIAYKGDLSDGSQELLTTALLSGFLATLTDAPVNMVNASLLAKRRGIQVEESRSGAGATFSRLVEAVFVTDQEERRVAGTLLGERNPRIVSLDGYVLDAAPEGTILLVSNVDKAGVVGNIGTVLGRHGINIAGMSLGRNTPSGLALALINLDSRPPDAVQTELRSLEHVRWVKTVAL